MTITRDSGTRRNGGGRTNRTGRGYIIRNGGAISIMRHWYPASWWWQNQPTWVERNHPDWHGDFDRNHVWHASTYWTAKDPKWVASNHPEWMKGRQASSAQARVEGQRAREGRVASNGAEQRRTRGAVARTRITGCARAATTNGTATRRRTSNDRDASYRDGAR